MASEKQYTDEEIREHFFNLFDHMPEDYAILAKLRYDPVWTIETFEYYGTVISTSYGALDFGFSWPSTPENREFWDSVYKASFGNGSYPPIPDASKREIEEYRAKHPTDANATESTAQQAPAYISISPAEYQELKGKADRLDKIMEVLK